MIVGSALAWRDEGFDPLAAVICLGFALLIQIGTNFANDYFDFVHGADTTARVGPRRAVAAGLVTPKTMLRVTIAVFAIAFVLGLSLLAWGGPWLVLVGIASILSGIAYTGGPFPLAYHGLGDLFVFVFFGLVAVIATYFVQVGEVSGESILAAIPIGLLTTNILVVNNYRDVETDAVAGKRTLVVRLGRKAARIQFALSLVLSFVVPVIFAVWTDSPWCLLPLVLVPVAWRQVRRLRESKTPSELIALLGATGKLAALYAMAFGVGLAL